MFGFGCVTLSRHNLVENGDIVYECNTYLELGIYPENIHDLRVNLTDYYILIHRGCSREQNLLIN